MKQDQFKNINFEQSTTIQPIKKSQNSNRYSSFFTDVQSKASSKQFLFQKLTKYGDISTIDENFNYLQLKIVHHTPNFQALKLQVKICYFSFEIYVFNSHQKSSTHILQNISCSHNSSIFINSFVLPKMVLKCIYIDEDNFSQQFVRFIKQFCILKIASILRIGPKLSNIFGFDIVIFKECAQFCMQKCEPIKHLNQKVIKLLKLKLKHLHSLSIVHLDIKPANISYSTSLKQPIFLDFGFSDILNQPIGLSSKTMFMGSIGYCSPEMIECYNSQCVSSVDLYYNDVYALEKSIQDITQNLQNNMKILADQEQYFVDLKKKSQYSQMKDYHKFIMIKFYIFLNKAHFLQDETFKYVLQKFKKQIILFCINLKYSQFINKIFDYYQANFYIQAVSQNIIPRNIIWKNYSIKERHNYDILKQNQSKFQPFLNGITIKRNVLAFQQIQITDPKHMKDVILKQKVINVVKKEIYFQKMVYFLDFYSSLANFQERLQAAKLMKSIYNIPQVVDDLDQFKDIKCCLKYLINFYISYQKEVCSHVIPIIWKNIILFTALDHDQAIQCFNRIINMRMNINLMILMLFRCYIQKQQQSYKLQSRPNQKEALQQINQMILIKFGILSNETSPKNQKIVKLILNLVTLEIVAQLPTVQFEDVSQLFREIQQQIQQKILNQLKIFYLTCKLKHHFQLGRLDKVVKYIQAIQQLQTKENQDYIMFQYYHFIYSECMIAVADISTINSLYISLEKCLDHPILLKNTIIYSYIQTSKSPEKFFNADAIFHQFHDFLKDKDLQSYQNKITCFEYLFNILKSVRGKENINPVALRNLYSTLRNIFPLTIVTYFRQQFNKNCAINRHIYIITYLFFFTMIHIHENDPNLLVVLQPFLVELVEKWMKLDCLFCKETSLISVAKIKVMILEKKQKIVQSIQVYKCFIEQASTHFMPKKIQFIVYIIEKIVSASKKDTSWYSYFQFIYEWAVKNDAWSYIITSHRMQIFQVINKYLFLKGKYQEYLRIQLNYLQIINCYPVEHFIHTYTKQIINFFFDFTQGIKKIIWNSLKQKILAQFLQNNFSTIFFIVIFLELEDFQSQKYKRILRFICSKISQIPFVAKSIVLSHLYYLIIDVSSQGKLYLNQRQKTYYFKHFMRNRLADIQYDDFRKKIMKVKKKNWSKNNQKIEKFNFYLSQYYNRLRNLCIQLLHFKQYYPSPFKSSK